jgi:glycosyltransferase involved in cell wall biosynthesis
LGRLSREETRRKIAEADLYILNSVYEGLPHTVIEAFSVGTPVIATDIPGTNEIAINNQTALTVKPENPADLAKAITRLMENPRLSNKLALAGAKLIASRFNWKTSIQFLGGVLGE